MTLNPEILITGAGGLLGGALCQAAAKVGPIVGIYHVQKPLLEGVRWIQMDLTDQKALIHCIKTIRPGGVIHAAAVAQTGRCQSHPEQTREINVTVPARLAKICADLRIPMVFTSTDLVFDGRQPPYSEKSPPQPTSVYGEQKARAEELVIAHWPEALVCRMPLMIGAAPNAGNNFTVQMLGAIAAGRPVTLFNDEYRTPVDIWSAAQGIVQFLGSKQGLLHLGGRTRVSRLEIGLLAAKYLGVAPTMIQNRSAATLPEAENRSLDCSLDSRRAFSWGYRPAPFHQGMKRTIDQWQRTR